MAFAASAPKANGITATTGDQRRDRYQRPSTVIIAVAAVPRPAGGLCRHRRQPASRLRPARNRRDYYDSYGLTTNRSRGPITVADRPYYGGGPVLWAVAVTTDRPCPRFPRPSRSPAGSCEFSERSSHRLNQPGGFFWLSRRPLTTAGPRLSIRFEE